MKPSGRVSGGVLLAVLAASSVLASADGNGAGVARVGLGLGFGLLTLDKADAGSSGYKGGGKDDSKDFDIPDSWDLELGGDKGKS